VIVLSNGDKWILNNSEWLDADISYEDVAIGKLPIMPIREFIEKLDALDGPVLARKWTDQYGGYWAANFNVYEEVFTDAASEIISNLWSKVYVMPWGHVYVVYQESDGGGYDICTRMSRLESFEAYKGTVLK